MDEFMFWLVGLVEGADGRHLLVFVIVISIAINLIIRWVEGGAARRDSRRRNQAHRIR